MYKKNLRILPVTLLLMAVLAAPAQASNSAPNYKLSNSKICHAKGSQHYDNTKRFKGYATLDECLQYGRLPAGVPAHPNDRPAVANVHGSNQPETHKSPPYDRNAFGGWDDADGDCINTRHEILSSLSTTTAQFKSRCSIDRGRWLDPYTDTIFTRASDLDIDHIVPLAYAWARGASTWDQAKRVRFANDPANLLPVKASVNRDKGARGPVQWLPPHHPYRCQYIIRFKRISLTYRLTTSHQEAQQIQELQDQYC